MACDIDIALGACFLLFLSLRGRRAKVVKPIAGSVAMRVKSGDEINRCLAVRLLEKALLERGLKVIPLPRDWRAWRLSRRVRREVRPDDPHDILEAEIGSFLPSGVEKDQAKWDIGVRVFSPDGRLRASDHFRFKYFDAKKAVEITALLSQPNLDDALDILSRPVANTDK